MTSCRQPSLSAIVFACFLEQRAGLAPVGVGRAGVGPGFERGRDRGARFGQHRRGRRMIEIEAFRIAQKPWICRLPARAAPI